MKDLELRRVDNVNVLIIVSSLIAGVNETETCKALNLHYSLAANTEPELIRKLPGNELFYSLLYSPFCPQCKESGNLTRLFSPFDL